VPINELKGKTLRTEYVGSTLPDGLYAPAGVWSDAVIVTTPDEITSTSGRTVVISGPCRR
jgi:hypothetical protein